jgi:type VI protein secretion system component VasK
MVSHSITFVPQQANAIKHDSNEWQASPTNLSGGNPLTIEALEAIVASAKGLAEAKYHHDPSLLASFMATMEDTEVVLEETKAHKATSEANLAAMTSALAIMETQAASLPAFLNTQIQDLNNRIQIMRDIIRDTKQELEVSIAEKVNAMYETVVEAFPELRIAQPAA